MWRPAVWRFGVCVALLGPAAATACWHQAQPSPETSLALANHLEPTGPDPSGAYWCSIDESGYDYPRFPCVIHKVSDHFELAKLGGSQRFTGRITPDGQNGFGFTGKLYCPWGACDQALHGAFRQTMRGELTGTFRDNPMIVKLVPAPRGAFGGAGYGGDGYGGDGAAYGGAMGGAGYGGNFYGGGTIPRP